MQTRTVVAALNGLTVLLLYVSAWGAPTCTVALIETALAAGRQHRLGTLSGARALQPGCRG